MDVEESEQPSAFPSYHSLLDYHPLLREHSRQDPTSKMSSDLSRSGLSSMNPQSSIDLEPLKQSAVMKFLSSGSGRICQYEVPGGGECRDQNCEDVHLSRLSTVEPSGTSILASYRFANPTLLAFICYFRIRVPSIAFYSTDEDTAQYLCSSIPAGPRYGVKAFRDALDVARLRHPTMPFDARVQEALTSLGLR
ncbi:hypothetical protein OH77DRAFT_100608 [Trametes cingulata]|nr:hypothetical protein OH77DRAFT_100608 [Trametes cingulata]